MTLKATPITRLMSGEECATARLNADWATAKQLAINELFLAPGSSPRDMTDKEIRSFEYFDKLSPQKEIA